MPSTGNRKTIVATLVAVALLLGACRSQDVTGTTALASGATSGTTTVTEPLPDPVFRIGLIAPVTTDNWWAALDTENSTQNLAFLTNMSTSLYTLSLPGFVHIPAMAATDTPAGATREGSTWVVTQRIHTDREWSDGAPITADDLVFYFDTVRDLGLGGAHAAYFPPEVASVSAPDEGTLRLVFTTQPGLGSWPSGVGFAPFIPAHFWEEHVDAAYRSADQEVDRLSDDQAVRAIVASAAAAGSELDPDDVTAVEVAAYRSQLWVETARTALYSVADSRPASAGALVLDSWEPGDRVVTRANLRYQHRGTTQTLYSDGAVGVTPPDGGEERFYGGAGTGEVVSSYQEGPFVSEIVWVESPDRETAYRRLVAGEVDYVLDPAGLAGGLDHQLREEVALHPDLRLSSSQAAGFRYLAFNLRKPPMSDPVFRRAVATVIDKEMVADLVLGSAAIPGYTIVSPDLNRHYDPDVPRPGWFSGHPLDEGSRFDTAIELLDEAGYSWAVRPVVVRDDEGGFVDVTGGRGLTMPNGVAVPPLVILAPGPGHDPLRSTYAIWIERWLRDLGVPVTTEMLGFDAIQDAVLPPQTRDSALLWDMVVLGWQGSDPSLPGSLLAALFHSAEDTLTAGGLNIGGYSNLSFDALADAFTTATNLNAAASLTRDMERIVAEDLPYVVLFRAAITEAYRSTVTFPVGSLMGGHQGYPNGWPHAVMVVEDWR